MLVVTGETVFLSHDVRLFFFASVRKGAKFVAGRGVSQNVKHDCM